MGKPGKEEEREAGEADRGQNVLYERRIKKKYNFMCRQKVITNVYFLE